MPFANWTDAKRRLDQMIAAARPDLDCCTDVAVFERNYCGRYLTITIVPQCDPIIEFDDRELATWDAIQIVKTWDQPDRAVSA